MLLAITHIREFLILIDVQKITVTLLLRSTEQITLNPFSEVIVCHTLITELRVDVKT